MKKMILNNQLISEELDKFSEQRFYLQNKTSDVTEDDFYPPHDNRVWKSNIKNINGGDNFADYCAEFFAMLDEEEYYDD